ncbi:MAG: hypothetical protein GY820_02240 [Gammaproteobacteria bacterium]|nr:hypothetical protein [Gammaproteobacteria bacterium]
MTLKEFYECSEKSPIYFRLTNNDSETMNMVLKSDLTRKESCQVVIHRLKEFCDRRFQQLEGAAFRQGDFCLKHQFRHLQGNHDEKSRVERENSIRSLFGCTLRFAESGVQFLSLGFDDMTPYLKSMKPADLYNLACKASLIRSTKNDEGSDDKIAPVGDNRFFVDDGEKPVLVSVELTTFDESYRLRCDKNCVIYETHKRAICHHTLAVADHCSRMKDYLLVSMLARNIKIIS